jgi:DNA-binding GntR family transcriptional regulator
VLKANLTRFHGSSRHCAHSPKHRAACSLKPRSLVGAKIENTMPTLAAHRRAKQPLTMSFELRKKIEDEIATGRIVPGSKLDETELAARFRVSRTPIREALIQLASTGFVEMRPRRGAVVPELGPQRLVEMFELMAELEAMCGRLAARRMSDDDHRPLVHAQEACEALRQKHDPDGYYDQNQEFHHVIYKASHNSFLTEQASALHRRLGPYRRLQLRVRDRIATSCTEHKRIVDAIVAGDGERAAELLREHVLVGAGKFTDLMASLGRLRGTGPLRSVQKKNEGRKSHRKR